MIENNATKTRWLRIDSQNRESMNNMLALVQTIHGTEIKEINGVKYVRFIEEKEDFPKRKSSTWRILRNIGKKQNQKDADHPAERQYCAVIMK